MEPAAELPGAALDALLPGGVGWPPASACVAATDVLDRLAEADRAWLASLPPTTDWTEAWRRVEREAPDRFGRTLAAVYDAYYSSPPVKAVLLRRAEAGPRDPDLSFDPALLPTPTRRPP